MFRVLSPIFLNNYCAIAQSLLSKTCKQVCALIATIQHKIRTFYCDNCCQVYRFAQQEVADLPTLQSQGKTTHTRTKKKKLRLWSYYCRKVKLKNDASANGVNNFTPCIHPGQPCDESCSCVIANNLCEKFCLCSSDCTFGNYLVTGNKIKGFLYRI